MLDSICLNEIQNVLKEVTHRFTCVSAQIFRTLFQAKRKTKMLMLFLSLRSSEYLNQQKSGHFYDKVRQTFLLCILKLINGQRYVYI